MRRLMPTRLMVPHLPLVPVRAALRAAPLPLVTHVPPAPLPHVTHVPLAPLLRLPSSSKLAQAQPLLTPPQLLRPLQPLSAPLAPLAVPLLAPRLRPLPQAAMLMPQPRRSFSSFRTGPPGPINPFIAIGALLLVLFFGTVVLVPLLFLFLFSRLVVTRRFGTRLVNALAHSTKIALLRLSRAHRQFSAALQHRLSSSHTLQAQLGARALTVKAAKPSSQVSFGLNDHGVGSRFFMRYRAPVLDERGRQRAVLTADLAVEVVPGRVGGRSLAKQNRSVLENLRYYLSGEALREAEAREAREGHTAAQQGSGPLSDPFLFDWDDLVAADARGDGPLSGEVYSFRVLTAHLKMADSEREIDVSDELGGEMLGDNSDDSSRGGAEALGGSSGRVVEAEWRDVSGSARGRR